MNFKRDVNKVNFTIKMSSDLCWRFVPEDGNVPANDLFLYLISPKSSKSAIAVAAQTLARKEMRRSDQDRYATPGGNAFELSVTKLEQLLEGVTVQIIHSISRNDSCVANGK